MRPFADNAAFAPTGFAFSTVLDLANVAHMLLAGGQWEGGPLLPADLALAMQTIQVPTYSPGDGGRSLGFYVDPHPGSGIPRIGHMGGITRFRALLELYPTAEAAVIVAINRDAPIGRIRDILLEEVLALPTAGWKPTVIEPDRGEWVPTREPI